MKQPRTPAAPNEGNCNRWIKQPLALPSGRLWSFGARLIMALAFLVGVSCATAQVILHPNSINGTVGFTNLNPEVLDIITNPASPINTYELSINAYALPPAVQTATSFSALATNRLNVAYQLTVDTDMTGISYLLSPFTSDSVGDSFYFATQNTPLLTPAGPPAALNFLECAGILHLEFVTSGGVPVPIQSLTYAVTAVGSNTTVAGCPLNGVPAGTSITNRDIVVPGGGTYKTVLTYGFGSNIYTDTVVYTSTLTNTVACDQILPVSVVIPSQAQLASAYGTVELVGEFAMTVPDWPGPYAGYTTVIAQYGPYNHNARWAAVRGTNFVVPASGGFVLTNLMPNNSSAQPVNYQIYGKMVVSSNRDYAVFETPDLGYGSNPEPTLAPGANLSLGDAFVIQPGYLRTSLLFQGPPETPGYTSALRNLQFSLDPTTSNGIPNSIAVYGLGGTSASMIGVDTRAPGASYTAAGGYSATMGQGAFNALTASYEGQLNLRLGGLFSQPSVWRKNAAGLVIGQAAANGQPYVSESASIRSTLTNSIIVAAGQVISNQLDFSYSLSEVRLQVQSSSGRFENPEVRFSSGSFAGTNFVGEPDSYSVYLDIAGGTPSYFTNNGLVVMYLPEGNYTLYPFVTSLNEDNSTTFTALQPLSQQVGRAQRIAIGQCLQISELILPSCTTNPLVTLSGFVTSCTNVNLITCQLNGGPTNVICTNCGAIFPLGFVALLDLSGVGTCVTNSVLVTAYDANGDVSSVTSQIQFNNVPPMLLCPPDMVISCVNTNQVPVAFSPAATSNCGGPVTVVCNPPSGSLFPAGTNTVTCYAVDSCGNQSAPCSFHVIVLSQLVNIQKAVIVTWGCGILQGANNVNGPWSDIPGATSPYCVPSAQAMQFYRTRQ